MQLVHFLSQRCVLRLRPVEAALTIFFVLASGKTLAKIEGRLGSSRESIRASRPRCPFFGMSVGHTLEEYDAVLRNWSGSRIRMAHVSFLRAVQFCEVGTIHRLIDEGADIEGVRDSRLYPYIPPLILAARCGSQRPEVFTLLVERGANPNVVSKETEWYGWTPLFFACRRVHCKKKRWMWVLHFPHLGQHVLRMPPPPPMSC